VVPGVSIASRGAVDSVALFTRQPLERVASIALDVSSRTSASLVRLLCARYFGIAPAFVSAAPDLRAMLEAADAALLIGDPALFTDPALVDAEKIDLGAAWTAWTGLPFVWAFWAGRARAASPRVCRLLQDAKALGLAAVETIAARERPRDADAAARIARYLTTSIAYDLEGPFIDGLETFFDRLAAAGLVERRPALRFYAER
jgi:chorismate dehydratase